jgi:hypothetical protein
VAAISPGLVRRLKRLTARRPALGLRLAGELGARLDPGSYWAPSASEVSQAFGLGGTREIARLRSQIASRELRNHVLGAVSSRWGMGPVLDCLQVAGGERLLELRREKAPVVIVFWHLGIFRAVPAALAKLGLCALVASKLPPLRASGRVRFQRALGASEGAAFLKTALAQLGDAGVVALSLDCSEPEAFGRLDFLGHPVWVARGPTLLARLGRARLVPVTSRWVGNSGQMQVVIHEPVVEPERGAAPDRFALDLLAGAVRTFESHARAHPEDLRVCAVRGARDSGRAEPLTRTLLRCCVAFAVRGGCARPPKHNPTTSPLSAAAGARPPAGRTARPRRRASAPRRGRGPRPGGCAARRPTSRARP